MSFFDVFLEKHRIISKILDKNAKKIYHYIYNGQKNGGILCLT